MRTFCPRSWNICTLHSLRVSVSNVRFSSTRCHVYLFYSESVFGAAGDVSAALQTLRALLLFYPSDEDSLDNLQLYSGAPGGATGAQDATPNRVTSVSATTFTPKI